MHADAEVRIGRGARRRRGKNRTWCEQQQPVDIGPFARGPLPLSDTACRLGPCNDGREGGVVNFRAIVPSPSLGKCSKLLIPRAVGHKILNSPSSEALLPADLTIGANFHRKMPVHGAHKVGFHLSLKQQQICNMMIYP